MSFRKSLRWKNEVLGNGSFGESHKEKENRNFVVVKTLSLQTQELQKMETFRREYKKLADTLISSTHIVKLLRVCITSRPGPQLLQCFSEFLDYNLTSFINRDDTDPKIYLEEAVEIAFQTAGALMFMHCSPAIAEEKLPVVHRHLSPNNILIRIEETGKLRIKIADAGLAQTFEDCFDSMTIVANENNRIYMAPELYGNICNKSMAFHYSPAVDVFSLGMILLEMCIGHPPKPFQTDQQEQSDLQQLDPGHPLKELLASCLCKDPNKRLKAQDIFYTLGQEGEFKNDIIRHDFQESKKLLIVRYNTWKAVRARTIEKLDERNLKDDIQKLNKVHREVGIVKASTSTAALIGGGIAIGGFIASFLTAGIAIPIMIAGGALAATGGLFTVGASTTEHWMSKKHLKGIDDDIADDIMESQSLRKQIKKFDEFFQRHWKRLILQDQKKEGAELYGYLQKLTDLPQNFENFMSSRNTMVEGARGVSLSVFTAAYLTAGVVEGARIATAAFQTLSVASRVSHLFGGIMAAITVPIDIYFIYTSIEELKKESEPEASKAIREMKEKMVLEEKTTENVIEEYIQTKVYQAIKERQDQCQQEVEKREEQGGEEEFPLVTITGTSAGAGEGEGKGVQGKIPREHEQELPGAGTIIGNKSTK